MRHVAAKNRHVPDKRLLVIGEAAYMPSARPAVSSTSASTRTVLYGESAFRVMRVDWSGLRPLIVDWHRFDCSCHRSNVTLGDEDFAEPIDVGVGLQRSAVSTIFMEAFATNQLEEIAQASLTFLQGR